eukprot:TRINITY_DN1285_c0_g1_i1.p1 TRINITY_DN1285_c0_g1~~TRINITY_DN1285_c0_g1_i1.p1  ORF type:complete len:1303 (+),score=254.98 TRINITY_DN1285_c0_g1_i1:66-3911(+)
MPKGAEQLVSGFSVRVTGAKRGDILVGIQKCSKGGLIEVVGDGSIPPLKSCLDTVRDNKEEWQHLIRRMQGLERFKEMTEQELKAYLSSEEKSRSTAANIALKTDDVRLRFLSLPITLIERLSESDMKQVLERKSGWTSEELLSLPGLTVPGSSKPSLIMLSGYWRICNDFTIRRCDDPDNEYEGEICDLNSGTIQADISLATTDHMYILKGFASTFRKYKSSYVRDLDRDPAGFALAFGVESTTDTLTVDFLQHFYSDTDLDLPLTRTILDVNFSNFGASLFKSALQKLIRYGAPVCKLPLNQDGDKDDDIELPSEAVTLYLMQKLKDSNGQFNPDIQRWVSGLESLTKRTAMCAFEDSDPTVDDVGVSRLMLAALLAQRVPSWRPSQKMQLLWAETILKVLRSDKAIRYSLQSGSATKPFILSSTSSPLQQASAALDEVRSFVSDHHLTRDIANQKLPKAALSSPKFPPTILLPNHAIDQHVDPNIVYLFPYPLGDYFEAGPAGQPFKPLMQKIFNCCTGVNPRRHDYSLIEQDNKDFLKAFRAVQEDYRAAIQGTHDTVTKKGMNKREIIEELDSGWLAGMVGIIDVGRIKGIAMIVTIGVVNCTQLVALRKPSRDATDSLLNDEERQELAKEKAKKILQAGVKLNTIKPPPHDSLTKCTVRLECDDEGNPQRYLIKKNNTETDWETARKLKLTITDDDLHPEWETRLARLLDQFGPSVSRRCLVYTSTIKHRITLNNVSRDGGCTDSAVVIEDIGAYKILCEITKIAPGVLARVPGRVFSFAVRSMPLLGRIRRLIHEHMSSHTGLSSPDSQSGWAAMTDTLNRNVMAHQRLAIDSLIDSHDRGLHGSFLFIPPGMGKTLIVMLYLQHLLSINQLPKYVIYTLPKSAMKNVLKEIVALGVHVTILRPIKSKKVISEARQALTGKENGLEEVEIVAKPKASEYKITMVEHDDLRVCDKEIANLSSEPGGYIFINDEVHKTLATTTKRTSVALDLASLSKEFIALTGTPIISSSSYPLACWLERISPFTVNSDNFWVAANAMIAHTVSTGIEVVNHNERIQIPKTALKQYKQLLPPALGGDNPNPRPEQWRKAAEICYDVTDDYITDYVSKNWKHGVMVIAKDKSHACRLAGRICDTSSVDTKAHPVFVLGGDKSLVPKGCLTGPSIYLTSDAVEKKELPPIKVCVVPVRQAEGYSLTYLTRFISSVYPCNAATREQLAGRINRISQRASRVEYTTVHCGILTLIHENHLKAHDLAAALQSIAKVASEESLESIRNHII